MSDYYILAEDGEPVSVSDVLAWGRWFETADRQLARFKIGDAEVSTVFLGLDHSHGGPAPVLWESMIFGGPLDGEQRRYTSREAAIAGHAALVAKAEAVRQGDAAGGGHE